MKVKMLRFKGMLKRRSRGGSETESGVVSPEVNGSDSAENNAHFSGVNGGVNISNLNGSLTENLLNGLTSSGEEDNTRVLMMDKIEQLTNEKYSLEDTLSDVKMKLERVENENLELKSISDDLKTCLELEKRKSRWQQMFYEKRIRQLTGLPVSSPIPVEDKHKSCTEKQEIVDISEENNIMEVEEALGECSGSDVKKLRKAKSIEDLLECNAFYEGTIRDLVLVQSSKSKELQELKKFYEDKLQSLNAEHEADVREILESSNVQVRKLMDENESLIRDLLTGCEGLFDELKTEFTEECRGNLELGKSSGENILVQFQSLSPKMKGVVIAGITVISVATAGWASWGFIVWVWPRLIVFAEVLLANPETSLMYLMAFLNSVPFREFQRSWEEGKSLGECLKAFANTEFLTSALRMAPDLFAQLKIMRGRGGASLSSRNLS